MKVLVITDKDGPNLFIENIVKELAARGHEIAIYAQFQDDTSIRMFFSLGVPILPLNKLKADVVEQFDFIFCPVQSMRSVTFYDKYVFSYCNMNPAFDTVRGADFVFTLGPLRQPYEKTFSYMPIGIPKNDTVVKTAQTDSRRILVVDSGHFPFAGSGKKQAAGMVLEMCRNFPEYEICVKPRWLPETEASAMTHINLKHLYEYIDELCHSQRPENLNLLMEHRDLQELIDGSRSVITMCTTAYLDVALRGKGLIVAKGFDNDDMYQVRKDYFDRIYAYAEGSGCVVDYREVCRHLPDGLTCRPEHLTNTFAYTTGASGRAVEIMEYIHENYLKFGIYPAIDAYDYETWKEKMRPDPELSPEGLKRWRMYCVTDSVVALNRSISVNIDWGNFVQQKKALCLCASTDAAGLRKLQGQIELIKYNYLLEHADRLMKNDVDKSFYFAALFFRKSYDKLIDLLRSGEANNSALQYYCGRIYYERGNFDLAAECLSYYVNEIQNRAYLKYFTETNINKRSGILCLLDCHYRRNNLEDLIPLLVYYLNNESFKVNDLKEARNLRKWIAAAKQHCISRKEHALITQLEEKDQLLRDWEKRRNYARIKQQIKKYGVLRGTANIIKITLKCVRDKLFPYYKKVKFAVGKRVRYYVYSIGNSFGWYSKAQKEVMEHKDRYLGQACVVAGNGPSLQARDLEVLHEKGYMCFAANKIYKIFAQTDWRPDFYACTDPLVFKQNCREIFQNINCPLYLNHRFKEKSQSMPQFTKEKTIRYLRYFYRKNKTKFYPDCRMVLSGGSVTYVLISLAWMMGFRTIYLIGCDHNYGMFTGQKVGAAIDPGSGINRDYFAENYMKPGEIINVGDLDKATEGYRIARDYIERHGGHLYNATRGGKLEVLERVDLDELVAKTQTNLERVTEN